MRRLKDILFLALFIAVIPSEYLLSQTIVSGFIKERLSGEVLIGANVYSPQSMNGTSSDNSGYFSLILEKNDTLLSISYVGYEISTIRLISGRDTTILIQMDNAATLDEVKIVAIRKTSINTSSLSRDELRYIPSIGAEPDVLKALQLLPGIQSQNEGSSNILVRGGGPGQNLFLLDNVPLFYVNHLGGFISVFNPEIINDVSVHKGGFPAKYGGKLSSVIDITLREGDRSRFRGSAGIGVTGAHLTFEGPIKQKTSYIITARKTFTEILLGTASFFADQDYMIMYGFYDLNGKISWNPDQNNQIQGSLYAGDDHMTAFMYVDSNQDYKMVHKWGNILGAVTWKHLFSSRLFSTNSVSMTRYRMHDYRLHEFSLGDSALYEDHDNYLTSIRDITLKSDWKYRIFPNWAIDYGIQSSYHYFIPNKSWETKEEKKEKVSVVHALESSIYLENHLAYKDILDLNIGVRGTHYLSNNYSGFNLEPRVNLAINMSRTQSLNFSYMQASQHTHMIFTSGNFVNNEVWVPTMEGMAPSSVVQYTAGWKGYFHKNMFMVEINGYMKKMSDLITYKEGYANIMGDAYWSSKIESGGIGESNGIELFIRKNKGNWSGFFSYALSKTTRQFDNINNGEEYVFEYDRPHCLTLDIHRKLNEKLIINAAWIYQTGLPYTPAVGRTYLPYTNSLDVNYDYEALLYGDRNSERMRDYHRLDVALNYKKTTKRGRAATWTFSIYNIYNRHNSYYYFYNTRPKLSYSWHGFDDQDALKLYQFSFFPIIPSVSYKVEL